LYLDTSVISYLDQKDAPEQMTQTQKFWDKVKNNEYNIFISSVVDDEISKCNEEKRKILNTHLSNIVYNKIEIDDKAINIAEKFVNLGILKEKSIDDCKHIAAAIIGECDIIVSWNFKHIVNINTARGVKIITAMEGYDDVLIYTPTYFIYGDSDDTQ
jgi:predicted nucleic acid-binding protein